MPNSFLMYLSDMILDVSHEFLDHIVVCGDVDRFTGIVPSVSLTADNCPPQDR
ncbi:MAG: hypothetical protein U9N09_06710 [Euryarchaeota archaeon]|nr:hypothetical protein [Euryarchaeota archaeon]